jgi:uncharacterized zinc-type alcohol dehydrogenase-like protein
VTDATIASDAEVIPIQKINRAYEWILKRDVHYSFVIDLASLTYVPRRPVP